MTSIVEHYEVTLTDEYGSVKYVKAREEVADFIRGINWANVYVFSVQPVEPLATWELELLNAGRAYEVRPQPYIESLTREELQMLSAASPEDIDTTPTEEEWRDLLVIPSKNFEINQLGAIRHKGTKRVMEAVFDIDHNAYRVNLTINGAEFSLFGEGIARSMWEHTTPVTYTMQNL
jgi:hypothetical protein